MKVKCQHGYFTFSEIKVSQVYDFCFLTGAVLVPKYFGYTFEDLKDAPNYSIAGAPLLNLVATQTFAGEPWEVFEANGVVYNFVTGLLVPLVSITEVISIDDAGNRAISSGLIIPGSLTALGQRVKNYSAWFSRDTARWLYSEVEYV